MLTARHFNLFYCSAEEYVLLSGDFAIHYSQRDKLKEGSGEIFSNQSDQFKGQQQNKPFY